VSKSYKDSNRDRWQERRDQKKVKQTLSRKVAKREQNQRWDVKETGRE